MGDGLSPIDHHIDTRTRMAMRLVNRHVHKCKHKQHKLVAFLMRSGNIVAVGCNHSHRHAETDVLEKAKHHGTEGTTLVIFRVRKNGSIGMSMPCSDCMRQLVEAGIRNIVYSDNNGQMNTIKVDGHMGGIVNSIKFKNMINFRRI